MIGLQPFQRRVRRPIDCFRRKILRDFALTATPRFAMVDEIVTNFCCDCDLVTLFRKRFRDKLLAQAVSIGISRIKKSNAEIERLVHERDRFALGKISPPTGGNRPKSKSDFAHSKVGIFVSTEAHRLELKRSIHNAQHPTSNAEAMTR